MENKQLSTKEQIEMLKANRDVEIQVMCFAENEEVNGIKSKIRGLCSEVRHYEKQVKVYQELASDPERFSDENAGLLLEYMDKEERYIIQINNLGMALIEAEHKLENALQRAKKRVAEKYDAKIQALIDECEECM